LLVGRWRQGLEHWQNVLFHGQFSEYGRLLREVADPVSGPEVHRKAGDIHTVEQYLPGVRLGQPDHDVKGCRLACAVRAEQPYDLALADPQIDVINNLASLVGLRQVNR